VTDWNQRYRTGDTPWEKGAPAPPLLSWMAEHGPLTGDVLVPGCGLGHDVRAIARASRDARVVGLDVAPSALVQAKKYPQLWPSGSEHLNRNTVSAASLSISRKK